MTHLLACPHQHDLPVGLTTQVFVDGLTQSVATSKKEVAELLETGNGNRAVAAHK